MDIHLTHRHRFATLIAAALLGLAAVACGGSTEPTSNADTSGAGSVATESAVEVSDNRFGPDEQTVVAGATVTWTWADGAALHNVVGDGFQSETQAEGTFTQRFDTPGAFTYVCSLHSGMDGTITVVPA